MVGAPSYFNRFSSYLINKYQLSGSIPLSFKRLSTIRNADIIYVIQAGSVVEAGDHDNLIKTGGAYKNLVSRQMQAQKKLDGADGK